MSKMINGKTESGFAFQFEKDVMDDMELVESLADLDEDPLKLPKVIRMVLGEDQKKALYDHCRAENGRVPVEKASAEFVEILSSVGSGKN